MVFLIERYKVENGSAAGRAALPGYRCLFSDSLDKNSVRINRFTD